MDNWLVDNLGMLEILGVQAEVAWGSGQQSRDVFIKPSIVKRANASTLYGALNDALGMLSIEGITELCTRLECCILMEVADAAKYVRKLLKARALHLPGNCFIPEVSCCIHRLHRIFTLATRENKLCGDGHAITFTSTHTHPRNRS